MTDRVVLAYSGGLDTSVAIPWIADDTGAEVIAIDRGAVAIPEDELARITAYFAPPTFETGLSDTMPEAGKDFANWVKTNVHPHRAPGYAIATIEDRPVCGIFTEPQSADQPKGLPRWFGYIFVGSVSRAQKAVTSGDYDDYREFSARVNGRPVATLRDLIATDKGEVTADVISAKALTKAQADKLAKTLNASTGKTVTLNASVDESLIGGLIVKVGSRMVDNSLRTKLQNLKVAMKGVS